MSYRVRAYLNFVPREGARTLCPRQIVVRRIVEGFGWRVGQTTRRGEGWREFWYSILVVPLEDIQLRHSRRGSAAGGSNGFLVSFEISELLASASRIVFGPRVVVQRRGRWRRVGSGGDRLLVVKTK